MRGRLARVVALLAILSLGAGVAGVMSVGANLSAPANREVPPAPEHLGAEKVSLESDSGSRLSGWLIQPESPRAAMVLLHGIRADRRSMVERAELLLAQGYAVLLPDLQAHGESPGDHLTFGWLEARDAITSVRFLQARFPGLRIGGLGSSLGGAALVLAGRELQADALVLEAVYPTIEEAVDNRIALRLGSLSKVLSPLLLAQLKPRLGIWPSQLRPAEVIGEVGCPVLIASGSADRHTTADQALRLFEAANEPKQLWMVDRAGHVDLLRFDPAGYTETVVPFLNRHLTTTTDRMPGGH